jgi:hypothetical protein
LLLSSLSLFTPFNTASHMKRKEKKEKKGKEEEEEQW